MKNPFKCRGTAFAILAVCILVVVLTRKFTALAWYPVTMSLGMATVFGSSLLGPEPFCLALARVIPPHILPPGAEPYCRRYTLFWTVWLCINALIAVGTIFMPGPVWRIGGGTVEIPAAWVLWNCILSYCATGVIVGIEWLVRRRRFSSVFHTSGSTAKPKRIVKTFRTLALETAMHHRRLADVLRDRPLFLATIDPGHLYGVLWRKLLPSVSGCAVHPAVIASPEELIGAMRRAEHVVLVTTPPFLARLARYAGQYEIPRNAVEVVTSGSLLDAETSAAARRMFGIAPLEIFGSTETGGVAWRRQDGASPQKCEWRVFDQVRVSTAEDGRLVVRSPFSYRRVYTMGDGVELSPDARSFRLLDRLDRMAKINGERVSLPEMEAKMRGLPGVRMAALVTLDAPLGTMLGAVVAGERRTPLEMRSLLLPIFPRGTVPRRFRFVDEIPRNAQGKVLADELRRMFDGED